MYAITGASGRLGRKLLKDGSGNLSRLIGRPTAPIHDAVFRSPCGNHARRSVVARQTTNGVTRACEARHRRRQLRVKSYTETAWRSRGIHAQSVLLNGPYPTSSSVRIGSVVSSSRGHPHLRAEDDERFRQKRLKPPIVLHGVGW